MEIYIVEKKKGITCQAKFYISSEFVSSVAQSRVLQLTRQLIQSRILQMINANTKMHCTECGKKLHPTQKFCTCSEPTEIAAALLQDDASCVAKAERKTRDVKEISDDEEISIISPSKYKSNTSSNPVSQSEARQAVLDSHGKQRIK